MPPFFVSWPLGLFWSLGGAGGQDAVGELSVTWRKQTVEIVEATRRLPDGSEASFERLALRFENGAKATFGVTTLSAQTLLLVTSDGTLAGAEEALAEGDVTLVDPEGTLRAERLNYRWRERTGSGTGVLFEAHDVEIRAKRIEMRPDRWVLYDVEVRSCEGNPPFLRVATPLVEIDPARRSTARKLRFELLGVRLGTLPRYSVGGGGDSRGIELPGVGLDNEYVPRMTWRGDFDLSERSFVSGRFRVRMGEYPVAAAYFAQSLLPTNLALTTTLPKSELRRRFGGSYLDNVEVSSPKSERDGVAKPRAALAVGASWNERPAMFPDPVTKPWELVAEASGAASDWAGALQLRWHRIDPVGDKGATRVMAVGALLTPSVRIGPSLSAHVRIDGRAYRGHDGYAWVRSMAALVYQPDEQIRLALGYGTSAEYGSPQFAFDKLLERDAWHVRSDLSFGPTHVGLLFRYDPSLGDVFGRELYVSHVMGCFEPYVVWRQSPRTLGFGFVFRPMEKLNGMPARIDLRGADNRLPVGATPP